MNSVSASFVTVRSASSVPPSFSHCVYVMTPGSPSTLFADTRSSTRPASRPCTRNFDMKDMSIRPTPSRTARCSASHCGNQLWRPHDSSATLASRPGPANQSAPSQPLTSRKYAPCSARRSWIGDRFTPRAVCIDRPGKCVWYTIPSVSTVRSAR